MDGHASRAVQCSEMRYFAPPTPLALYSDFSPDECERRLRDSIDIERPTMFGFSGYRGSKPFLGEVEGKQFRVLQRIYNSRNTLPPVLTGEFQPQGTGTRVKGIFDLEITSKIAICLFDVVGLLILVPIFIISRTSHPVLLALFVCGYGALIIFSPRIFRGIGLDQEKSIADFLRETLVATDVFSSSSAGRDS
jgi:hypothetical protein